MTTRAVTATQLEALKRAWASAVVAQDADALTALYAEDAVLKPTLSSAIRRTPADIREYFTGGTKFNDAGFLTNGFSEVRFTECIPLLTDDIAVEIGAYAFIKPDGSKVEAHYTFCCQLMNDGAVRIRTHHSSLAG